MKSSFSLDNLEYRIAKREELPQIIQLLTDDTLGQTRETYQDPLPQDYYLAFDEINEDPNNDVIVALNDDEIVATMQITIIPNLTFTGKKRLQIEGVRVKNSYRGFGIGQQMMEVAIKKAQENNCHCLQLTTNKQRADSYKFYKNCGFIDSHVGFKYYFNE